MRRGIVNKGYRGSLKQKNSPDIMHMGSFLKIVNGYHALKDVPYPQDGREESESKGG